MKYYCSAELNADFFFSGIYLKIAEKGLDPLKLDKNILACSFDSKRKCLMAINYRPIGFSYREHQKYAQLCKVAGKYNYSFNEADSLKYEMQALMWYEHKNIDPNGEWAKPPKDGKLYDPYEGVAEPTLPFYSLEECQDALRSLITNLKLSDAPKCTAKAQKLAMRTIKMLDRVKKSKRYEQHCDAVLKYKERCEKRALEKVES